MESRTITLLKEAGKRGLLLTELAQQLERPAKEILKVVESLTSNGHVEEIEETHNGESVLRLVWQNEKDSEWETLEGCPCFACSSINICGAGQPSSPWFCDKLNNWIKSRLI